MPKYTTYESESNVLFIMREDEDGRIYTIPTDPANSDYQAYLRWLENPDAEITYPNF